MNPHAHSLLLAVVLAASVGGLSLGQNVDVDSDGDGLSDFAETHKYRTDPSKADSDGDGKPDGDWNERREYTYSLRTVLRVLPPCSKEAINDDYQDARVRTETERYVELEVVHYPLNTCQDTIESTASWRAEYTGMHEWLDPRPATDWNEQMRTDLVHWLAVDGIDLVKLTDKEAVERVASWTLNRCSPHNNFNGFHVHFPDNVAKVLPDREKLVMADRTDPTWSMQQQLENEVLGREMFYNRRRGTCTSTAILLTTVLRAIGIPTRMVLCTPIVDASGGDNIELVRRGLTNHRVRETILNALSPLRGSNASHTFNEVFVGGRWRRLNYERLGQNILGRGVFGLLTHVHTFNDLADAGLTSWGGRQPDDVFKYQNSYTALEVSDLFGAHSELPNPAEQEKLTSLKISKARWLSDNDLPANVRDSKFPEDGSGHLFLHADRPAMDADGDAYKAFYDKAGKQFRLTSKGNEPVVAQAERGYWLNNNNDCREFYLRIPPEELKKMKAGVAYAIEAVDQKDGARWIIADGLTVKSAAPAAARKSLDKLTITKVRWAGDADLPENVRKSNFDNDGSGHLFLHADRPAAAADMAVYNEFYGAAGKDFKLVATGQPELSAPAERGFWIDDATDCREFYVHISADDMKKMKAGVSYKLRAPAKAGGVEWVVSEKIVVKKR